MELSNLITDTLKFVGGLAARNQDIEIYREYAKILERYANNSTPEIKEAIRLGALEMVSLFEEPCEVEEVDTKEQSNFELMQRMIDKMKKD